MDGVGERKGVKMDGITLPVSVDIKKRRRKIGISQVILAGKAGVSYRTVIRLEKGGRIRDEKLGRIINVLEKLENSGQKPGSWWLSHYRE